MRRGSRGIALAAPTVWLALALGALGAIPAGAAGAAPPDARYAAVVHSYQGCIATLPAGDRALLALRFGSAGTPGVSAATAAARLHTTPAALQAAELKAVRRLEGAHRAGRCPAAPDPRAVAVQGYQVTHTAAVAAATTSSGLSWTSPTELALLAVIVLALGALIYGVRRDFGPQRLDRERFGVRRRRDR